MDKNEDLKQAQTILEVEAKCITAARDRLDNNFVKAVSLIVSAIEGGAKVVVTGIGKSGKIADKVAATLASTGIPAFFLHSGEGLHGDLGIVSSKDVLLAFSYSGASEEVQRLLPAVKGRGVKVISVVGNMNSYLAKNSDFVLDGSVEKEACPLNLAPTSSTTVALAIGDALSMVLATKFGYGEEKFATNHPGGSLGRRLTLNVSDLMHKNGDVPWIKATDLAETAVIASSEKKLGAVLVKDGKSFGIITDGDIRRALKHKEKFFDLTAKDIMTKNPVCVQHTEKAIKALELMENRPSQISVLPVTDDNNECIGILRLHDLIGKL